MAGAGGDSSSSTTIHIEGEGKEAGQGQGTQAQQGSTMSSSAPVTGSSMDTVTRLHTTRPSLIGRVRTLENVTNLEWAFLFFSVVSIGVGFGFTIYRISTLSPDSDDLVFSFLVLANLCFATFYLIHGVFQEQPFEILTLIMTTVLLWILIMINYLSTTRGLPNELRLKLIRFLISSVLTVPSLILAILVGWNYWKSGKLIFKLVGGDMRLQRMCRQLFFGLSLLIFDAQAMVSCVILIMRQGVSVMTPEEIFVLIAGAVFTGIWLVFGYVAMRMENMTLTLIFGTSSLLQPVYVCYLFVSALDLVTSPYSLLTVSIFISGGTLLLAHFTLLAMVMTISHNYGKGLKEKIYGVPMAPSGATTTEQMDSSLEQRGNSQESLLGARRSRTFQNYLSLTSE